MPGRILIVDDFEDARDLYAEYLRLRGFEVSCAADGPAALAAAQPQRHDAIVLDLALPRMGGMEVLRALRADPQAPRTPIIILSASVGHDARDQALAAGADLFLEKPCLPDELEGAIRQVLSGARKDVP